ncbi:MAG: type II toxin-antitoxin system VapC family toxin [Candidatus Levybacteria bacterium]|nr:type II toxin-antitoxin system VapC family toxin [Candidatus Levybacteria bacterium]
MNYLVDTHVFLWAISAPEKLSKKAKSLLLDVDSAKYISLITFWEISLKFSTGKIDLKGGLPESMPFMAKSVGLEVLSLDIDTVSSFYKLPKLINKDPFDRMLAWQAISKGFNLLTKDQGFTVYKDYGLKAVW